MFMSVDVISPQRMTIETGTRDWGSGIREPGVVQTTGGPSEQDRKDRRRAGIEGGDQGRIVAMRDFDGPVSRPFG